LQKRIKNKKEVNKTNIKFKEETKNLLKNAVKDYSEDNVFLQVDGANLNVLEENKFLNESEFLNSEDLRIVKVLKRKFGGNFKFEMTKRYFSSKYRPTSAYLAGLKKKLVQQCRVKIFRDGEVKFI
jgi:hypothetical protein